MESFFYQGQPEECTSSWIDETWASLTKKQSDFVPYLEQKWLNVDRMKCKNVKMRMVEMLRERWRTNVEASVPRMEKSFRHMVKERLRRQSHKEGYMKLRAILPIGTKCDKISITTAATSEIIKMQRVLEELRWRNKELNEKLEAEKGKVRVSQGTCKLRIRVDDPTSGLHSMVETLHCLKELGSDVRKMRSHFSEKKFSAELEINNSQIAEDELEKAVQKTFLKQRRSF